jgi:Fe-S-cluster containining protein
MYKKGPPHCCEIILGAGNSPMYPELIERAIEGYDDHLRVSDTGEVFLTCTHLDKENGVCTIYEERPQICRDYNCVSWAQVNFSHGAPKERLLHYNKIEKMLG